MPSKRHHFVPEVYLNEFRADDGKLTVFRKEKPSEPFRAVPSNVALQGYYYSFTRKDETRDTDSLEQIFSAVESLWPTTISNLRARANIGDVTENLLEFASIQRARVPAIRDAFELMRADSVRSTARVLQRFGKLPEAPAGFESILDNFEISVDPESSIKAIGSTLDGMIDRVFPLLGFSVIHNKTNIDFITSDNPVMWYD